VQIPEGKDLVPTEALIALAATLLLSPDSIANDRSRCLLCTLRPRRHALAATGTVPVLWSSSTWTAITSTTKLTAGSDVTDRYSSAEPEQRDLLVPASILPPPASDAGGKKELE
jgi:hypothetical protein